MAGKDFAPLTPAAAREFQVTTDEGGNVGNANGESMQLQSGVLIADVPTRTTGISIDLKPYLDNHAKSAHKVYAHLYHTRIEYHRYEEFVIFSDTLYSEKLVSANQVDSSVWSIDSNAILTADNGGNRSYKVRIEKIM